MAWYKTGTVSVTNGQTSVTGTGTKFATNARVGDGFNGPDGNWYEVTNIASETVLAIFPAYQGTTVSGSSEYMIAPLQGYNKESADRLRAITDSLTVVTSVAGKTGDVLLSKSDVGLSNVDNTSDLNKPISSATQTELTNINTSLNGKKNNFTVLPIAEGGTNATDAASARTSLGAAKSGANNDISSLSGLSTALTVAQGGTGGNTQALARSGIGAAKSGVNGDITELTLLSYAKVSSQASPSTSGSWAFWNTGISGLSGSSDFVCNNGGGTGGFSFRSVNANNTASGPTLIYSYAGQLTIPLGPVPANDGGANVGSPSLRWSTIYAVTGTIQTSDAREKTPVRPFGDQEISAAMALSKEIGVYKWLSAIEEKGEENARNHSGMTVQRAVEIMESHNLNPLDYAFICYDEWAEEPEITKEEVRGTIYSVGEIMKEDALYEEFLQYSEFPSFTWQETSRETIVTRQYKPAGNRYGFRYDQLGLFIARGQEERLSRLEALLNT